MSFFSMKLIRADWMHCWHMGVGRDLAGAALKIMARCKYWYPLRNIKLRLRAMTRDIKEFAKGRGKQLSIKYLKKSTLHWYVDQCPELHASAYDTAVIISWLVSKLETKPPEGPYSGLLSCVWCADHLSRIITEGGVFQSEEEKANIEAVGLAFLSSYSHLARTAFLNSEKLFKLRPKIHHVDHAITEAAMDGTGRNYGWDACWYDEDWVKYCMKAYRRVSVQTAQKNLLLRNLVQIKEALEKAVLNMDS